MKTDNSELCDVKIRVINEIEKNNLLIPKEM